MEIGNRDRTVIVSMLAGLGHRLRHLLRAAGLAKSTYYHLLSHPAAATEQVFGHLKDEFHAGREFASYEQFKNELDAYIIHWNTKRRQIRLEGHTPEEFRNMSLTA